jgi:hypothetical protein
MFVLDIETNGGTMYPVCFSFSVPAVTYSDIVCHLPRACVCVCVCACRTTQWRCPSSARRGCC